MATLAQIEAANGVLKYDADLDDDEQELRLLYASPTWRPGSQIYCPGWPATLVPRCRRSNSSTPTHKSTLQDCHWSLISSSKYSSHERSSLWGMAFGILRRLIFAFSDGSGNETVSSVLWPTLRTGANFTTCIKTIVHSPCPASETAYR